MSPARNCCAFALRRVAVVCVVVGIGVCIVWMKGGSQESDCDFVSSRGIMKTCDVYPSDPRSSAQTVRLDGTGSVIYVQGSAAQYFITRILPSRSEPFVLVTGDCDETVPDEILSEVEFRKFISDPRLVHWFSQNLAIQHPKMTIIPIGLDYHSMVTNAEPSWGSIMYPTEQEAQLKAIAAQAPLLKSRAVICYSNFHFSNTPDREQARLSIPSELMYYEKERTSRREAWKTQSLMAFVVSPRGHGYDCHRTWEALALGCIPIVKHSPIDHVFDHLPVLIVKEWSDVNKELLVQTLDSFANRTWEMDRLTLKYWSSLIRTLQ